jgi:hypothetical protein
MKKWNVLAALFALMFAAQVVLRQLLEQFIIEWHTGGVISMSRMADILDVVRGIPMLAIHIGSAVWLRTRAIDDRKPQPTLWTVFGLCFGPFAVLLYITLALAARVTAPDTVRST